MRKESVAGLDAPCLRSATAVGITPQEHKGSGTPKSAARKTAPIVFEPMYLTIDSADKNARIKAAIKNPNKIKTLASSMMFHDAWIIPKIMLDRVFMIYWINNIYRYCNVISPPFQPEADPPLAEWGGLRRGVKTKKRVDSHPPLDPLPSPP